MMEDIEVDEMPKSPPAESSSSPAVSPTATSQVDWEPDNLPATWRKRATEELLEPEDVSSRAAAIEAVRVEALKSHKVQEDPGTVHALSDNDWVQRFLRGRKWSVIRAVAAIEAWSEMRVREGWTGPLGKGEKESMGKVASSGFIGWLPGRDSEGRRVLWIRGARAKAINVTGSIDDHMRLLHLALDAALSDPTVQVAGVRLIVDCADLSIFDTPLPNSNERSRILNTLLGAMPIRLGGVWVVREPLWFGWVHDLVMWTKRSKVASRYLRFGSDIARMQEMLAGDVALPEDLGNQFGRYAKFSWYKDCVVPALSTPVAAPPSAGAWPALAPPSKLILDNWSAADEPAAPTPVATHAAPEDLESVRIQ